MDSYNPKNQALCSFLKKHKPTFQQKVTLKQCQLLGQSNITPNDQLQFRSSYNLYDYNNIEFTSLCWLFGAKEVTSKHKGISLLFDTFYCEFFNKMFFEFL